MWVTVLPPSQHLMVLYMQSDAEMVCRMMTSENLTVKCKQNLFSCGLCGGPSEAFRMLSKGPESVKGKSVYRDLDASKREVVMLSLSKRNKILLNNDFVTSILY